MIARVAVLLVAGGLIGGVAAWSGRGDSQVASSSPVAATPSGRDLFAAKGCAMCHDGPESSSGFDAGPSLRDPASWAGGRVAGLSAEDYITQSILDPSAVISPAAVAIGPNGARMPTIAMGPGEVDALVAFLLAD